MFVLFVNMPASMYVKLLAVMRDGMLGRCRQFTLSALKSPLWKLCICAKKALPNDVQPCAVRDCQGEVSPQQRAH
jgi:hypothetical protein